MKVTLLVPTLNEIIGMRVIMPRIQPEWCDQVLVIDAGTDATADYAREMGYEVLTQRRKGIRHAYIEAFPHIRGDVVITFSPDGNSVPEYIPELIAKMADGYDMVIVSRYLGGLKSEDDSPVTRFGNWMLTTLINRLHGGRYTDSMVMFRAWKRDAFTDLDLDKDDSYAPERWFRTVLGCEPLLSIRAAKRGLAVTEIAGPEPPRIGGERKLQIVRWGAGYLAQILREKFYWR